jgi:hypothetical protein
MNGPIGTSPTTTAQNRTPEELDLIQALERIQGRTLTEQEANHAIAQARELGEL